jgi:type II secretory pathway pseudopilin PulG
MRRAFTAIELMIVIAVLMILVGLMVPTISGIQKRARMKLAKTRLTAICLALESYRRTNANYPPDTGPENEDGDTTNDPCSLYKYLGKGGYMEFDKEDLRFVGPGEYDYIALDPWGNPWVYEEHRSIFTQPMTQAQYQAKLAAIRPHNPMSFDLYSTGPDGQKDPMHNGLDDDGDGKVDEADELVDDVTNW